MAIRQEQIQDAQQRRETMAVDVVDVFKIYKESNVETVALRGIDLQIKAGEFVAIMGPSGSGKSTLLNLIGGIDTLSAGQVHIMGQDIAALPEARRATLRQERIGFVFQNHNLLPSLTALENVVLPIQLAGHSGASQRGQELLSSVGVGNRLHHRLGALSGGEQQRVGIACALANDPVLLLADEPTGELDSATAQEIMQVLVDLHKRWGMTIVLVTHDSETAAFADRIIRMRDGHIEGEAA